MKPQAENKTEILHGTLDSEFETLVHSVIPSLDNDTIAKLRNEFLGELGMTISQPESSQVTTQVLWDFFYDWCLFEKQIVISGNEPQSIQESWTTLQDQNVRGLFLVQKASPTVIKLKDLLTSESYQLTGSDTKHPYGVSKGDIIEARLIKRKDAKGKAVCSFVRCPCFHPPEVHPYLKKKVRTLKKSDPEKSYGKWLWATVSMYLKHRLYSGIPTVKIYDDNSRI